MRARTHEFQSIVRPIGGAISMKSGHAVIDLTAKPLSSSGQFFCQVCRYANFVFTTVFARKINGFHDLIRVR